MFFNTSNCSEGFYGLRLYVTNENKYLVGVCINRMDLVMPVKEFVNSELAKEIEETKQRDLELWS